MNDGASDEELLNRLQRLISDAVQRCATLERVVATILASGLSSDTAQAALAESYRSLQLFKHHVAQVEQRMKGRTSGHWSKSGADKTR